MPGFHYPLLYLGPNEVYATNVSNRLIRFGHKAVDELGIERLCAKVTEEDGEYLMSRFSGMFKWGVGVPHTWDQLKELNERVARLEKLISPTVMAAIKEEPHDDSEGLQDAQEEGVDGSDEESFIYPIRRGPGRHRKAS